MVYQNRLLGSIFIFGVVLGEVAAQSCLQMYHSHKNPLMIFGAIGAYTVVCIFLLLTYNYINMGLTNALWSAISVVAIMMIGHFVFHDKLYLHDLIGVILIFSGMSLIYFMDGEG